MDAVRVAENSKEMNVKVNCGKTTTKVPNSS
jgi:hypothetical protein